MGQDWKPAGAAFGGVIIVIGVAGWFAGGWVGQQKRDSDLDERFTMDSGVYQCYRMSTAEWAEQGATADVVRARLAAIRGDFERSEDADLQRHGVALTMLTAQTLQIPNLSPASAAVLAADIGPRIEAASDGLDAACARYGY